VPADSGGPLCDGGDSKKAGGGCLTGTVSLAGASLELVERGQGSPLLFLFAQEVLPRVRELNPSRVPTAAAAAQ
jgi:hypothetical protein